VDWLSLLANLKQYSEAGVVLAGVAFVTSQYWLPQVKKFVKLPSFTKPDEADPSVDMSDVEALHLLQARAKRSNCPALKKAVRDVEVCFFNHVDQKTAVTAKPEV
jgi:hypothetical protein